MNELQEKIALFKAECFKTLGLTAKITAGVNQINDRLDKFLESCGKSGGKRTATNKAG